MANNYKDLIQKQPPMRKVVYALIPIAAASVYFFGWRSLVMLAIVNIAGFLTEFLFAKSVNKKVTEAVFVTNFLFALSLPPTLPFWMAVVGIVFGVLFGKMIFGGFGRNVFNPAISGRAFIYASFGGAMTSHWVEPVGGPWGGFLTFASDTVSSATPLALLGKGEHVDFLPMLWGNTSGSLGETSTILILLGGLFLLITNTSSFRIVIPAILCFGLLETVFWLAGIPQAADPLSALMAGSVFYGIMFMATDPVSASQTTNGGRWIYGGFIGLMAVVFRLFSNWPAGITFAILMGNVFAPLLDTTMKSLKERRKAKEAAA